MDSDITPIFDTTNENVPHPSPPREDDEGDGDESTPLDFVQPEEQHSYVHPPPQYYYPPPAPPAPPAPAPAPQIPQWDPFKHVTTSTWVILVLAFVLGFFIGKQ